MKQKQSYTTDVLFTVGLFCLFAATAFILVMIGVHVYQRTVDHMQDTFSTRTALSYVAEKLRQHDTAGAVELTELDGTPALRMTDRVGDSEYATYIYSDGGSVYELTVGEGTQPSLDLGEQIIAVRDFAIRDAGNGFLEFSASDSAGGTVRLLLHLRSEAA